MGKCCSYCGQSWKEEKGFCAYCGAPVTLNGIAKYDPFFYGEYIVYAVRDYSRRSFSWTFYKGVTLIKNVEIDERELETYNPTIDIMPIVIEKAGLNASR